MKLQKGIFWHSSRIAGYEDQACIARSTDGGKTFSKWEGMGFKGHPMNALRLPDKRVLITYGYRHRPFGIRARILNEECTDFKTAPEIILREDGGSGDLGYTGRFNWIRSGFWLFIISIRIMAQDDSGNDLKSGLIVSLFG